MWGLKDPVGAKIHRFDFSGSLQLTLFFLAFLIKLP